MKKLFLSISTFFVFTLLTLSVFFVDFKPDMAKAFNSENTTTAVKVDEIWNDTAKKFDDDNLTKLLQFVTGSNTVRTNNLSTVKTQATNKKTASAIRGTAVTASTDGAVKTASKDIIVTLGGLDWTPVYLSNDTSSNPILTLWLANSNQLSGKKYYTSNTASSSFGSTGTAMWNSGFDPYIDSNQYNNSATPASSYPDNMYGMSAIRSTVLNNGGSYSTANMGKTTATMSKKSDSVFSKFTVTTSNSTAIADYLTVPTNVSWQKSGQDITTQFSGWSSYKFPNENLTETSTNWYTTTSGVNNGQTANFNYSSKSNYTQWGNDRLWLPSMSETGYDDTHIGIWSTTTEQRSNATYSWLRSGLRKYADGAYYLYSSGASYGYVNVNNTRAVRPALHLNLNSAAANTISAIDINTCVVSNLSNSQWNPVSNPIPTFTLKTPDGKTTLTKDTDYTVTSSSTSAPGTITLTIKGKSSKYEGTKTVTYQLEKRSITRALRDNTLSVANQTWTGENLTPALSGLKDYAYNADTGGSKLSTTGVALTQNTHYTLSYTNNKNIGTATITITGAGNYTGSTSVNFNIVAVDMSLITVDAVEDRIWNPVSNPIPEIVARYTGANKTLTTADYTVTSSAKTDGTAVPGEVTLTITGKGNYTGTKTVKYMLNRRDIGLALMGNTLTVANQTWTGERIEPVLTGLKDYGYQTLTSQTPLSPTGVPLTYNTHYVLNYTNNIDLGTATVTITGNGFYYTGTTSTAFTIVARSIADGTLSLNQTNLDYNFGEDLLPSLVATLEVNNKTLTTRDYDLSYYSPTGSAVTKITDAGTYKVRATGKGNYTSAKEINFVVSKLALREEFFTISPSSYEYKNSQIIPTYTASYTYTAGKTYNFRPTDFSVTYGENVNASTGGTVTFTGAGSNFEGTVIKKFTITAKSISAGDITKPTIPSQTYTGSAITPSFTLTDATLGRALVKDSDYTVTFTNNVNVGESSAVVKVTGIGNYAGETALSFEITPRSITLVNIAEIPDQSFTGLEITPVLNITDNGASLIKDTHYTVTFANNITVTNSSIKASATLVGVGNYEGTTVVYFNIIPVNISGAIFSLGRTLITGFNYEEDFLSEIQENATLKINTTVLQKNVDYKISALNADKTAEIGNIVNIGKYIIRATGLGNFIGTNEIEFEVTKRDISQDDIEIELDSKNNDFTYNGESHEATIKVFGNYTIKGVQKRSELVENRDYTVSYDENTNASTSARVLITGIGNFTSVKTKNFTIKAKMLDGLDIVLENDIPNQDYTGTTLSPTFVIKDNTLNLVLAQGTHYSATYTNNTNAGEATITLTGIGNYGGTKVLHFNILPRDISLATILEIPDQVYTSSNIEPVLTVTDNGRNLVRGVDYLATFKNNINVGPAGSAQITINGINNYQGKKDAVFTILPADLADARLELSPASSVYTGKSAVTSIRVIMNENNAVVADKNYQITYLKGSQVLSGIEDLVDVGTYTIRISGQSNYEGTIQENFVITPCNMQDVSVLLSSSSFVYNQSSQTPVVTLSYNGLTLTSGTDYILTYRQTNESGATVTHPTNAGTYAIILEGKGNYQKTNSSLSFEITPASLNKGAVATFSSDPATANITFDNSTHKIILSSLKINNVEFFSGFEGEYATVSYLRENEETTNFINAGTITIKISAVEGNSNVIGEKTYTYEIKRKNLATADSNKQLLITGIENKVYNRNAHTQNVVINDTVADYALTSNDFSVTYSTSCINAEEDIVIYINSNASGNYSGTITRTFNIEKAIVNNFVLLSTGAVYSARPQVIEVEVRAGSIELTPSEYKLEYKRNNIVTEDITNIGDISVGLIIVSTNFKIETPIASQNYTISKITIDSVTLTNNNVGYNGETYVIDISSVVGEGGVVLKTTDYIVSYTDKDNNALTNNEVVKAGVYTVKVTGVGNAQGSKSTTFTITPRELTSGVINYYKTDEKLNFLLDEDGNKIKIDIETNYRGQYVLPEIQLVLVKDTITLTRSTDGGAGNPNGDYIFAIYSLKEGEENKNLLGGGSYLTVGEYNFVITGINNYSGTISKNYKVNLADFSNKNIRIDLNVQKTYQGEPVTFQFASTQGESAEAKVYFVQEDFEDEELILGKTFQLFSGYIKITLNGNNDITKAEISSKEAYDTLNEGSNDDGTTWSILFVNNGYVNNNSVGMGTLVIQGMEDSPFTTNTIVAKQFGISKVILRQDNLTLGGYEQTYVYSGTNVINPEDITITVSYRKSASEIITQTLIYGTDYELTINDCVNAGNVNVTIKGINTFEGNVVYSSLFVINKKDINSEDENFFTISPDTVYTKGVEQKPEITASYNSKEMVLGVDYTVTYKRKGEETTNFTNAGEIVLEFVGIGNFTGSITKVYTIQQLVIKEILIDKDSATFTGSNLINGLTITVNDILGNEVVKEDGTEFSLMFLRNGEETTNFSDAGIITICVITNDNSNYTVAGEEVSTIFTINKVQLSATTPVISSEEYTGTSIQPNFDLTLGEGEGAYTLNANEYEIKGYRNNINVSKADNKAVILLQATNKNFEGTKEVEFEITAKDISNGVLGFGDGEYQSKFTYNGSNQTPNFSLTYLTNKLVLDTDYTITITRTNGVADASLPYKNVGEFSVEISGIGNYKGTVTVNYEIEALSLSLKDLLVEVTFSETSFEFTGSSIEPTITSVKVNFNGTQLSLNEGTDYTLEYSNNLNAGNATMTLKGNGNFADSAAKSFEILRKRLTNDMVKSIASHSYNKEQIQLSLKDITFEYHSYEFTNDDFEISYLRNPRNVGTYVITISGKGNFSGSIEASFEITPISLEDAVITFTNEYFTINECTFTGSSLRRILIDSLIVYIGDVKLDSNDYGITFADPSARYLIDVGTKNFTLVENGSKNIIGSKAGSFIVSPKLLENFMLEVSKDELVYTGEEIKPRFTLTYNGVALVENTDYDIEYYDNTLATSSASFTIKGKNNYSGSLSYDFVIKKATPTVELKKDIEVPFFVGDKLTPESIKPYLDFSTEGIIDFTPINSLKLGGNTITYTFIPNDNLNYERIKGTIEPRAVYNVKVTFGVENNSKDVIASASTQIPVQVEVIINGETFALDKSRYSVVITLLDKDVTVNDFSNAGNYEIRIRLNSGDEENYYFQTPNSVRFYAKTKTIFVENTPFFAVNEDYFEEGISLVIETYRLKTEIINAIGSKNYESVQNVSKVYKVVGFFKNGVKLEGEELEKLKDVKIYFKAANYEYFVLLNDYLQTANGDVGNIQLEIGSFLIETIPSNSVFIIIICVVLALIVLIIIILLILKLIKNRKIKKASKGTVDIEKLNTIANSANMARNNNQNTMQNSYANNQNLQGINIPSQTQIIQNPNAINNNINSNGIMQQNISQNNNVNNAINQSINPNQNGMVNSPINNAGEVNTNLNNQNNQSTPINPSNLINNKAKPTTTRKPNKPNNK